MSVISDLVGTAIGGVGGYIYALLGVAVVGAGLFIGYQHIEIGKLSARVGQAQQAQAIAEATLASKQAEFSNNLRAVEDNFQKQVATTKATTIIKGKIHEAAKHDVPSCGVAPSILAAIDGVRSKHAPASGGGAEDPSTSVPATVQP